jgi:hypothetical protein
VTDPVLGPQVLGNKNDLKGHAKVDEIIEALGLRSVTNREVSVYSISGAPSPIS